MPKFHQNYQKLLLCFLFYLPLLVAAQKRVTGTVTDSTNAPVVGASVSVRGTSVGTNTNSSGQFTLNVNEGQTIVITSVGYEPLEVLVTPATSVLSLNLRQAAGVMSDVVVVGYGTSFKEPSSCW